MNERHQILFNQIKTYREDIPHVLDDVIPLPKKGEREKR